MKPIFSIDAQFIFNFLSKDSRKSDHQSHSSEVAQYVRYTIKLQKAWNQAALLWKLAPWCETQRGPWGGRWKSLVGWTLVSRCYPWSSFRKPRERRSFKSWLHSGGPTASCALCHDFENAGARPAQWDTDGSSVHLHIPGDPDMPLSQNQTSSPRVNRHILSLKTFVKRIAQWLWWQTVRCKHIEITLQNSR